MRKRRVNYTETMKVKCYTATKYYLQQIADEGYCGESMEEVAAFAIQDFIRESAKGGNILINEYVWHPPKGTK